MESNLRKPHCLSAGTDSLYLQLKPRIRVLYYLCKHTSCTVTFQEHHFLMLVRTTKKTLLSGDLIMGIRRIFSMGCNVDSLLILFKLLTIPCKWTFTKRFNLATAQAK